MTTAAQTAAKPSTSKFSAFLRNIFIHFVKAHELQAVALVAIEQDRAQGARKLNRMADQFEATQPNLANELRFIASRG